MIKKLLYVNLIVFISLMLVDLVAYTYSAAPPASHTGAPGESTCVACHAGSPVNSGSGNVSITLGNGVTTYKTDSVYTITVQTTDITKIRFGFELTALTASNDSVGTFILINNANTDLQTATVGGKTRKYVAHKNAGNTKSWQFNWRAPNTDRGNITFYATGNAANNDFSTTGDLVYSSTLQVTPEIINGIGSQAKAFGLFVSQDRSAGIRLNYSLERSEDVEIRLYDLNGRIIYQAIEKQEAGKQAYVIDQYPNPGFYFISLRSGAQSAIEKIIVQ